MPKLALPEGQGPWIPLGGPTPPLSTLGLLIVVAGLSFFLIAHSLYEMGFIHE